MKELLTNLTSENISYIIVNTLIISGVLYVSIYYLVYSNKKIVTMVYNNKPTFLRGKDGIPVDIPQKDIRNVIKEKVTFFIGMLFSAIGALLQCVLDTERIEGAWNTLKLMIMSLIILNVIIFAIVNILSELKTKRIVDLLRQNKLEPDVPQSLQEY